MIRAAAMCRPVLMAPPSTIVPPNTSRISATRANGLIVPVCPPAPALTAMMPSTPASDAFSACRRLMTSWNTRPPYECTASTTSRTAPRDVMTKGTLCRTTMSRSASRRWFDLLTIRLTPKGAASAHAPRRPTISSIQAARPSLVPAVECGEGSDQSRAADLDHQVRPGDEEHGRCNRRQLEAVEGRLHQV